MANECICDRCGKTVNRGFADNFINHLYLKEFSGFSMKDFDLCEECEASLYKWLENKECSCKKNENVVELLEHTEMVEQKNKALAEENEKLREQNRQLVDGVIQQLIEKCHFKIEFNIDD